MALYRFGYLVHPTLLLACAVRRHGRWVGIAVVVLVAAGLLAWWWRAPESFWRLLGWFYLAQWRRWWVYYRHWYATCANLSLAMTFGGDRYFPTHSSRSAATVDGDLVTVTDGQRPAPGRLGRESGQPGSHLQRRRRAWCTRHAAGGGVTGSCCTSGSSTA